MGQISIRLEVYNLVKIATLWLPARKMVSLQLLQILLIRWMRKRSSQIEMITCFSTKMTIKKKSLNTTKPKTRKNKTYKSIKPPPKRSSQLPTRPLKKRTVESPLKRSPPSALHKRSKGRSRSNFKVFSKLAS